MLCMLMYIIHVTLRLAQRLSRISFRIHILNIMWLAHLHIRLRCLKVWRAFMTSSTSLSCESVFMIHPSHVISYKPLDIQLNLTYEELLVQVLDRKE
jgi:hypothetical protein